MRIANHEVTPLTLIHVAILGVAAVVVILFSIRSYGKVRESWERDTINAALAATEPADIDNGIASCKAMIAADKDRAVLHLLLGTLQAKKGEYKDAREAFEAAGNAKDATSDEKSMAFAAAAACVANDGAKDGKAVHINDALKLNDKAAAIKATPEALAGDALLQSWNESKPIEELDKLVNAALAAQPAPSAQVLDQLYRLQGSILLRQKKNSDATAVFNRDKFVNPFNSLIGKAAQNNQLNEVMDTSLDYAIRAPKIEKLYNDAPAFGKDRSTAILAAALALHTFNKAPNYMAPDGPFTKARTYLNTLIQSDGKDPRAYRALNGMLEERIEELAKDIVTPLSGFRGETKGQGAWDEPLKPGTDIAKEDIERLGKIRQYCIDQENIWQRLYEQSADKKERVEARSRQLLAIRRQIWCTRPNEQTWRDALFTKARQVATDLSILDETGYGFWQLALVQIDNGNLGEAFAALGKARERGKFATPEIAADVEKLYSQFNASSEVVDYGPVPNVRQFGTAQVLHATLKLPDGAQQLVSAKIELDGKEKEKLTVGTQIFSIITPDELKGEGHKVKVTAQVGAGTPIVFPEFSLNVDKDAPTWSLAPGTALPGQSWMIELKDASPIEWGKLSIVLKMVKVTNTIIGDKPVVRDGRYARGIPALNIKMGDLVRSSPITVAAPEPLPAGDYKILIEVSDAFGNKLKDEKAVTVK